MVFTDSLKRDVIDPLATLNPGESTSTIEKIFVNCHSVKVGMLRFSFMLESCQPGSLPDPHLIAALLQLVSRCPPDPHLIAAIPQLLILKAQYETVQYV